MAPGRPERIDYEYTRNGTANQFMISEPFVSWRAVKVTERRAATDFAKVVRWLVEEVHEEADKVVLVMDNLNTHRIASLYEAFPPERARRIAERLEIHHTPKHRSWLNMAEIELSVLAWQCLDRRIESAEELRREVGAWGEDRNERMVEVRWQFTTADARIKLHRLYPVTEEKSADPGDGGLPEAGLIAETAVGGGGAASPGLHRGIRIGQSRAARGDGLMDKAEVAAWMSSLTDKQFVEFFYESLASRHLYEPDRGHLDSHLVLANARRDLDDDGVTWGEWELELLCPADEAWADDAPVCQFGEHCGLGTASWAKQSVCPVCGGKVYGT